MPLLTRRELLKSLGIGALAVTATDLTGVANQRTSAVKAFPLSDVRLLNSLFRDAQLRDARYLLSLKPDRMLHNFRVNAGLTPKAPVYAGWESAATWEDIRCHGHTLGHYLSACSFMFASTNDPRFKQRTDYIITELRECQNAGKTGLVCAFPDGDAQFKNIREGKRFVGVVWYTMHKIFAGLLDTYLHTNNRVALPVLVRLADWANDLTKDLSEEQFQRMLGVEHGGMSEVLADIHYVTKESRFLRLAERFAHRALLDPLSQSRDVLNGLHSNTQIPKAIGFNRLYELTGKNDYRNAARFFWQTVVENRSFATGGNSDVEHFFPPSEFSRRLESAKTMETCCSYNMLRLTRALFAQAPSASYADFYERALYNSILASQDPDSGMVTYFQPTRPGYLKLYCTPTESFWCCTGSGMESHAKYGDSIYFHDERSLYVNLFIPSLLNWSEKGIKIRQVNRFPEEAKTRLEVIANRPTELTIKIRHPYWCQVATITVNGRVWTTSRKPGSYVDIKRVWRRGDRVEVQLPMSLWTQPLPGNADVVAILYGPIVLAGRLGRKGLTPGADMLINERTTGDVLNEKIEVPVLVGDPADLINRIKPRKDSPLTFQTVGLGRPSDVTLIPYYKIAHERYNLYWKVENRAAD